MKKIISGLIAIFTIVLITSCSSANHTHSYKVTKYDETTHWKECECGEKIEENHTLDDWTIDKSATCIEEGSKSHHCQVCAAKMDITSIPATGHTFGEWKTTREPTISTTGTKERECSSCLFKETETISALSNVPERLLFLLNPDGKSYSVIGMVLETEVDLIIPSIYKNLPVTRIGDEAFSNCSSLTSVTIPDSVTSIEYSAFSNCSNLTSVTIGNSVTQIGYSAFSNCSSLTNITLPASVTSIYEAAFSGCNLTSVIIPDGVTTIGSGAFRCEKLQFNEYDNGYYLGNEENPYLVFINAKSIDITTCEIHSKTRVIADSAFSACRSLTSITIPNSVTSIRDDAFSSCRSLKYNEYDNGYYLGNEENPYFVFVKAKSNDIINCEIHRSTKLICGSAFSYCSSLTSITIQNSVISIGNGAFSRCENLTNVYYEGTIEDWCNGSFTGIILFESSNSKHFYLRNSNHEWEEVTSIEIPNTITKIGAYQFYGFNNVTSIVIPDSVTIIGEFAFSNCSSLTSITIPNSVTNIGASAFSNCSSLASIEIPQSVMSLELKVFSNCSSLTSVVIPDSVTSIGDSTFYYCSSLTSVIIPDSVTSIGYGTFMYCNSLTSITIPDRITSIGERAFFGCDNLQYNEYDNACYLGNKENLYLILIKAKSTDITTCEIYGNAKFIYDSAFSNCSMLTSIIIPNCVRGIGEDAFSRCSSLASVTIPDSITRIENGVFNECSGLTNIVIPDSVKSIGESAFNDCRSLTNVYYEGTIGDWCYIVFNPNYYKEEDVGLGFSSNPMRYAGHFYIRNSNNEWEEVTSIEIPNSVTNIGTYQFYGFNNVTSITIPESVKIIGLSAFSNCSSLANVNYEGTIEDWCNIKFWFSIYSGCTNPMSCASHFYLKNSNNEWEEVTSIEIPDTITEIGVGQFYGFNNVASISIPNSVTSIGDYAFSNCSNISSIIIPNSMTSIGDYAFWDCSSLTSITIPNSVVIIGYGAFSKCTSLESITIPDSVTSIGKSTFENCNILTNVYYEGTIEDWCHIDFYTEYYGFGEYGYKLNSNPMLYAKSFYLRNSNNEWEEVTSIEIPNTITMIGDSQFYGFDNVTSITISNSVTTIGNNAFAGCNNIEKATIPSMAISAIPKDHLKEVVLTGGESIGESAFRGYKSLTSVTIPDSITSIGNFAFKGCSSLESITLPNSVISIGDEAFSRCTNLTSIIIPKSVTRIGKDAFKECSSLSNVYYNGSSDDWNNISKENDIFPSTSVVVYYYSETQPTGSGYYWHYVDGVITKW